MQKVLVSSSPARNKLKVYKNGDRTFVISSTPSDIHAEENALRAFARLVGKPEQSPLDELHRRRRSKRAQKEFLALQEAPPPPAATPALVITKTDKPSRNLMEFCSFSLTVAAFSGAASQPDLKTKARLRVWTRGRSGIFKARALPTRRPQ